MHQTGFSRGAELLREWRGDRQQKQVLKRLKVAHANYSRYELGDRKPPISVSKRIERVTGQKVPWTSWYEAPIGSPPKKRSRKS